VSRIHYLADEDLRRRVVVACRQIDPAIEFLAVRDVGLSGADDEQVLEYAASAGFIVVSHDKRTMVTAAKTRIATGMPMAGLILVGQKSPAKIVAEHLAIIWACDEAERWQHQIDYLPWT
jgi:predicted nuclease of predicted toxin-antitoxin system